MKDSSAFLVMVVVVFVVILIWLKAIFDKIKDRIIDMYHGYDNFFVVGNWNFYDDNETTKYRRIAKNRMEFLIKEIIKCRYCDIVLENPPLNEEQMDSLMHELRLLEKRNPDLRQVSSPTNYIGYNEKMAKNAYGSLSWEEMKRSLDLIKMGVLDEASSG